jgi:hypothetical protein
MIKLQVSSSNNVTFIPSSSFQSGDSVRYRFTNTFTEETTSFTTTYTKIGDWLQSSITLPTDIDLKGGTYDVQIQRVKGIPSAVWGELQDTWSTSNVTYGGGFTWVASTLVYSTAEQIWSVGGADGTYINDTTTRAWVSESIADTKYVSTNENAAYVVYEG